MNAQERHIPVTRTARYFTLGEPSERTQEVWFACHGYGQLAEYFIRNFRALANEKRFIIAPEGLSRFYLQEFTGRIGATWMTREDRETEIRDYVAYLDALYARCFETLRRDDIRVVAFGFSQGVTTVCRWLTQGSARAERLILWAGGLPAEMDWEANKTLFQSMRPVYVYGTEDEFIKREAVEKQRALWAKHGVTCPVVEFEGGHAIDIDVLTSLEKP